MESNMALANLKFPLKLWKIINECTSGAIRWNDRGDTVLIHEERFYQEYLRPELEIFKTANITSFVRQLNLYGFKKVSHKMRHPHPGGHTEIQEFKHSYFLRGRPDLMTQLSRKTGILREKKLARQARVNAEKRKLLDGFTGEDEDFVRIKRITASSEIIRSQMAFKEALNRQEQAYMSRKKLCPGSSRKNLELMWCREQDIAPLFIPDPEGDGGQHSYVYEAGEWLDPYIELNRHYELYANTPFEVDHHGLPVMSATPSSEDKVAPLPSDIMASPPKPTLDTRQDKESSYINSQLTFGIFMDHINSPNANGFYRMFRESKEENTESNKRIACVRENGKNHVKAQPRLGKTHSDQTTSHFHSMHNNNNNHLTSYEHEQYTVKKATPRKNRLSGRLMSGDGKSSIVTIVRVD